MKKKIWIFNHYASSMFKEHAGRHFWFSENLHEKGYEPTIFCASTIHNSDELIIQDQRLSLSQTVNQVPFVFVRTPSYKGNRIQRIKNMIAFYKNLFPVAMEYSMVHGKPDCILASSVHPLTLIAGIRIAKKLGVPCICEVRDLWPESIVAYGILRRNSLLAKLLYLGEKWIYKQADAIIMTWEGGKQYILDQGWGRQIDISKVKHISNGIVIDTFDSNSEKYRVEDMDLSNPNYRNVVYAGSIRKVNNIGMLLDAAKIVQGKGIKDIRFLIYGAGDELESLKKRCNDEGIENVIFKGKVEKKFVPYILKNSYINILHNSSTSLDKYGQSQNKFFEYLAAGKCIVQTYMTGYSICERYNCGISASVQNAEEIAKAIIIGCDENVNQLMGKNAREAAATYDFKQLTGHLVEMINQVTKEGRERSETVRKIS